MQTTIQKWGNSQAIRLPKVVLENARLKINDKVDIQVKDGEIIISQAAKLHKPLSERMKGYTGDYKYSEWDTGKNKGSEF